MTLTNTGAVTGDVGLGFDLYVKLLEEAVTELKGETVAAAMAMPGRFIAQA